MSYLNWATMKPTKPDMQYFSVYAIAPFTGKNPRRSTLRPENREMGAAQMSFKKRSHSRETFRSFYLTQSHSLSCRKLISVCDKQQNPVEGGEGGCTSEGQSRLLFTVVW